MNEQEKKKYSDEYKKEKEQGVPFFPDIIFKDTIAALLVFIILAALAYFVGAPLEARANPARFRAGLRSDRISRRLHPGALQRPLPASLRRPCILQNSVPALP